MPWVTFSADYGWRVPNAKSHTVIAYKTGMKVLVKQACADDAKAAGVLVEGAHEESSSLNEEISSEDAEAQPSRL